MFFYIYIYIYILKLCVGVLLLIYIFLSVILSLSNIKMEANNYFNLIFTRIEIIKLILIYGEKQI